MKLNKLRKLGTSLRVLIAAGLLIGITTSTTPVVSIPGALAATTIRYEEIVVKALRHTHDVRISGINIRISKAQQKEALSLYFPTVTGRWNSEYNRDLSGGVSPVTAVGDTIFTTNTIYQNSLSLSGSYNVFDCGAREKRYGIAKSDVEQKKILYKQTIRDTKLKVLRLYTDLLLVSGELEAKDKLLGYSRDISLAKERLYNAGLVSRIDVTDEALMVVKIVDAIDILKQKRKVLLRDLALFTAENYEGEGITVVEFPQRPQNPGSDLDIEKSPEYRIYDMEIEKKKAELEIIKREMLPQISLYSHYVLYGSDPVRYLGAFNTVRETSFAIGIVASIPLFEGFKSLSKIERLNCEIDQLKVEKEKKLAELAGRYGKAKDAITFYGKDVRNQQEMMKKVRDKLAMVGRMSEQMLVEHIDLMNQKMEVVRQGWELTKSLTSRQSTIYELQILSNVVD